MFVFCSFPASFVVQQICCAFVSLSIACMQWYFCNACNTHILRAIVVMNICQFVQEITYAYSTYMLIMTAGRRTDKTPSKFDSFAKVIMLILKTNTQFVLIK